VLVLGCASLVLGYERPDLDRRFGEARLPGPPEWVRYYLLALLPWAVVYEIGASLGVPAHSLDTSLPLDAQLPVWPWTEAIYASIYLAALLAPLVAGRGLRTLTVRACVAMALVFPIYFCCPTFAPRPALTGDGVWAGLLQFERALDPPSQALPSFHAIWAFLIAAAIGGWKKCYAQNKAAPFILVTFIAAPLSQTIYGMIVMNWMIEAAKDPVKLANSWATMLIGGIFAGMGIGVSAWFQGFVGAAGADAMAETGQGFGNYLLTLGILETVALFVLVFVRAAFMP